MLNSTPSTRAPLAGLRPHACPLCPKAFRRPAHLSRHLRGHGPQPPLRCAACPRTFPEPAQLRRARPFQCVRCQREFKRLADLARHAQVHAGGPAPPPGDEPSWSLQTSTGHGQ
uniref:C2H2-type domain-containing protein n=1 Tax=Neovison vison TaxID=452646 RepID=A0A8C7AZW1_NEOVI